MKIHFKSTNKITKNGSENKIEFDSRLIKEFEDGFNVLTFWENREDGKKIKTRIEYNNEELKIYSGVASLYCKLNSIEKNDYFFPEVSDKTFNIYTKLTEAKIEDNFLNFKYYVSHKEEIDLDEVTSINLEISIINE